MQKAFARAPCNPRIRAKNFMSAEIYLEKKKIPISHNPYVIEKERQRNSTDWAVFFDVSIITTGILSSHI